jgi:hypothetical protein
MEEKEQKKKASAKVANRKTGPLSKPKLDTSNRVSEMSTIEVKASLGLTNQQTSSPSPASLQANKI